MIMLTENMFALQQSEMICLMGCKECNRGYRPQSHFYRSGIFV